MKKRNFWGLLLVLYALSIFAKMLNLFPDNVNAFTLIVSIALVGLSLSSIPSFDFFSIIMPLSLVFILNQSYFNLTGEFWSIIWPALLLSFGLNMLFKGARKRVRYKRTYNFGSGSKSTRIYSSKEDEVIDVEFEEDNTVVGEKVYIENNLGEKSEYVNAKALKYAKVENNLGALNVYFDHCEFKNGCVIDVENNLGSTHIYLPKEHNYISNIDQFMGNQSENNSYTATSGITIHINGEVSMGEISIIYV